MGEGPTAAQELGAFLRSRRERTRPEDLGLEPGPRRKVVGLRREEVAALAGLSTDYYQRMEQGRSTHPSDAVLDSLADALDLDEVDRRHLVTLARLARRRAPQGRREPDTVPENTERLLAALQLPAFVVSRHLDVLAWNALGAELLGDPHAVPARERNVLLGLFRDEDSRLRCAGWRHMVLDFVGMLRTAVTQDPDHPRAAEVVGELSIRSADFRHLWARHEVRESVHGTKRVRHPRIGEIDVEWDAYALPTPAGAMMIVFTPGAGHEDRLGMLASLAATDRAHA